jgi:hypothetical protein
MKVSKIRCEIADCWKVDGDGSPFLYIEGFLIEIRNLQIVLSCGGKNEFRIDEKYTTLTAARARAEFIMSELLKEWPPYD